ncbi:MAG: rod shape-determining protein MreC [candidate division Zixibacteria bacterium]|nr:rod shape-determining protein MreC [candidate division Zixibacteria bacterium]
MSWISTQFSRHWRNIHIGFVVVLSVGLVFSPPKVHKLVGQALLSGFYYPFFKIKSSYELLASHDANNVELRASLTKASFQLSQLEEVLRDNQRLRTALGFEQSPGYRLIPTEVISVFGYKTPVAAIVNRGDFDGLEPNLPVINQDGLIGRISSVTPDYATVQLLTDPANRVAARIASSREMGIVKFSTSDGMILDNFPLQGTIAVGDTILSSGLGGVYPPGMIVGTVTSVERHEDEAFCRVTLDPAANFWAIDELFILGIEDGP